MSESTISPPSFETSKGLLRPENRTSSTTRGGPPERGATWILWVPSGPTAWKATPRPSGHHTGHPPRFGEPSLARAVRAITKTAAGVAAIGAERDERPVRRPAREGRRRCGQSPALAAVEGLDVDAALLPFGPRERDEAAVGRDVPVGRLDASFGCDEGRSAAALWTRPTRRGSGPRRVEEPFPVRREARIDLARLARGEPSGGPALDGTLHRCHEPSKSPWLKTISRPSGERAGAQMNRGCVSRVRVLPPS